MAKSELEALRLRVMRLQELNIKMRLAIENNELDIRSLRRSIRRIEENTK